MMTLKTTSAALIMSLAGWSAQGLASEFESCPTHAFLMQKEPATLYSVDLATGFYETLSDDLGTSKSLNAMAFNFHDNYLYAYSKEFNGIVRIHSEYTLENLAVSNMPDTNFYVGDIALTENTYYLYRPGASYGLYKISLDSTSSDYLNAIRIIDGGSLNISIYDFATHPESNGLYAVDKSGNLHLIDTETGSAQNMGNTGVTGVFGAAYFDENGTLYISRNSDGYIFRINVDEANPKAEFFANGPLSSKNDGARCALASLVGTQSTIDFGDAPESYATSLDSNGARHNMVETMVLGDSLGGDDDGVTSVTGYEQGATAALVVSATGGGYLNVWVDADQSQAFESTDQVVTDQQMSEGDNLVVMDIPDTAVTGETWMRVRYSSTQGIGPTGGVSDGEVEDHRITITPAGTSVISYPGSNEYTTLAFEDHWPLLGDYDMNDVVVAYRTHRYISDGLVNRYVIEGRLLAHGAGYRNGFAVQLDNIQNAAIDQSGVIFTLNGELQADSPLEENAATDDAVLIVAQNLWDHVSAPAGCEFYRTEKGCDEVNDFTFYISVPLSQPADPASAPQNVLNPFIFATPGFWHGVGSPGRGLEIHLKNKPVSARFDYSLFGSNDDRSSYPATSFLTSSGMPWAIEFPVLWDHPVEKTDLVDAYPEFIDYVLSLGALNRDWYMNPGNENRIIINF